MKSFANIAFSSAALLVADAYALGSCNYRDKEAGSFQITTNENGTSTDINVSMLDYTSYKGFYVALSDSASSSSCAMSDNPNYSQVV